MMIMQSAMPTYLCENMNTLNIEHYISMREYEQPLIGLERFSG